MEHWQNYWAEGHPSSIPEDEKGVYKASVEQFWRPHLLDSGSAGCPAILEIACGNGALTQMLFGVLGAKTFQWTATDRAKIPAEHFQVSSKEQRLTLQGEVNAEQLPYADHQYDWVVSQFGIEYASDIAFKEALRVLKPGGRLLVVSHSDDSQLIIEHRKTLSVRETLVKFLDVLVLLAEAPQNVDHKSRFRSLMSETSHEDKQELALIGLFNAIETFFQHILQWSTQERLAFVARIRSSFEQYMQRIEDMVLAAMSDDSLERLKRYLDEQYQVSLQCQVVKIQHEVVALATYWEKLA